MTFIHCMFFSIFYIIFKRFCFSCIFFLYILYYFKNLLFLIVYVFVIFYYDYEELWKRSICVTYACDLSMRLMNNRYMLEMCHRYIYVNLLWMIE